MPRGSWLCGPVWCWQIQWQSRANRWSCMQGLKSNILLFISWMEKIFSTKMYDTSYQWYLPIFKGSDFFFSWMSINLSQSSVAFYRETSHLLCIANQMTGFCMKCNTRLEWIKEPLNKFLMMLLISSKNSGLLLRSWPDVIYSTTWGFEFDTYVFVRRVCWSCPKILSKI